jgi:hypothetical protein
MDINTKRLRAKAWSESLILAGGEPSEQTREFVRNLFRKHQAELSASIFGVSTSTATESKPLTMDEIDKALGLVERFPPVRPFDLIQCSDDGLKRLGEEVEITTKTVGDEVWITALGVHVDICPSMPDDMLILVETPKKFGDLPKVYGIVNLNRSGT